MKLGITCTSQPMQPNARYVSSFRNSETAVTASDRSIENLVIVKYEGSCPTSVMSVPWRVVTTFKSRCARDRKSTCLNSSHDQISYAVFCLKKKKNQIYSSTTL